MHMRDPIEEDRTHLRIQQLVPLGLLQDAVVEEDFATRGLDDRKHPLRAELVAPKIQLLEHSVSGQCLRQSLRAGVRDVVVAERDPAQCATRIAKPCSQGRGADIADAVPPEAQLAQGVVRRPLKPQGDGARPHVTQAMACQLLVNTPGGGEAPLQSARGAACRAQAHAVGEGGDEVQHFLQYLREHPREGQLHVRLLPAALSGQFLWGEVDPQHRHALRRSGLRHEAHHDVSGARRPRLARHRPMRPEALAGGGGTNDALPAGGSAVGVGGGECEAPARGEPGILEAADPAVDDLAVTGVLLLGGSRIGLCGNIKREPQQSTSSCRQRLLALVAANDDWRRKCQHGRRAQG
mmetsp:Transcript_123605/g.357488  ORF Transcript_123605/g.357488 Transcript_123605/m.357488 type:complete len:352 (+) Transcript_123605:950-2005(+)